MSDDMKIETPAEACAALAVMIVAADEVGTVEEREFLFETVRSLPMFEGMDRAGFTDFVTSMTQRMFTSLPMQGSRISSDGVRDLLGMIREALPAERRVEALEVAVGLAQADGVECVEALLLQRLCEELEIGSEAAQRLLKDFTDPSGSDT